MLKSDIESAVRAALAPRLEAAKSRKEKTRIAATTLFFEYGIYPSGKVVHSYTQQGSMTDINRDLREFWSEIRDKSKVRIDAPSLPPELQEAYSNALAKSWELAMQKAAATFEDERKEAREREQALRTERDRACEEVVSLEDELSGIESDLVAERERRSSAEAQLAGLQAKVNELSEALARAEGQIQAFNSAMQADGRKKRPLRAKRTPGIAKRARRS